MAEGQPPRQRDGFALSLGGVAESDFDDLAIFRRPLSHCEIEAAWVAGLEGQKKLVNPAPPICVQVGRPVEVAGAYRQAMAFPELFDAGPGRLLLRGDDRTLPAHFYDARDAMTPAGKPRWFQSVDAGATWTESPTSDTRVERVYRLPGGDTLLLGETARHAGKGVFQTSFRNVKLTSDQFPAPAVPKPGQSSDQAVFHVAVEPNAEDGALFLNRSAVQSAGDSILITGYVRPKHGFKSRLFVFASRDKGRTWDPISEVWRDDRFLDRVVGGIGGAPPLFGPTQACLLRTSPHRIVCAFRTDASLLVSESRDEGRSWENPWMAGPDGANPTLVEIGDLLALSYGRPDVNLALSADGGRTWFGFSDILPVNRAPVEARQYVSPLGHLYLGSTCHASLVAIGGRRLLLAYDTNWISAPEHELPRTSIWTVPITLKKANAEPRRFVSASDPAVTRAGAWEGVEPGVPYACTQDAAGRLHIEFDGTGAALVHPTLFDGGRLRVRIDGCDCSVVDLRTPNAWWGRRTQLATGLPRGKHRVELIAEIRTEAQAPLMPNRWGWYEPYVATLYASAGRTRAVVHGFEVW